MFPTYRLQAWRTRKVMLMKYLQRAMPRVRVDSAVTVVADRKIYVEKTA